MKYNVEYTAQFKKDIKLAQKQGKNIDEIFEVIEKLANDELLDERYRDHALGGDYVGHRECHIEPDWLLIYKKYQSELILYLVRNGSHSELF